MRPLEQEEAENAERGKNSLLPLLPPVQYPDRLLIASASMQPWFEFGIASLATWRIAVLISKDRLPFKLGLKARKKFESLNCLYCVSIWAAALIALHLTREPFRYIVIVLALSAAAILINEISNRLARPIVITKQ